MGGIIPQRVHFKKDFCGDIPVTSGRFNLFTEMESWGLLNRGSNLEEAIVGFVSILGIETSTSGGYNYSTLLSDLKMKFIGTFLVKRF